MTFAGKKHSDEAKAKIGAASKRRRHTVETRDKMRLSHIGLFSGDKHPCWRGDDVGYNGIHIWVYKNVPKPNACTRCNLPKRLNAHNLSGEYKRDVSDWVWICYKCHMIVDGRLEQAIKRMDVMHMERLCQNK